MQDATESCVIGKKVPPYEDFDAERKLPENIEKHRDRSPFEIDKGRIIHSGAFRRLQGKTQVLGVGERDFYRTRLTHSLEVAQIGRGMCAELVFPPQFRPDPDLLETICLAHDIGHPPFGHSGEETLHRLLFPEGGFGANPQNIRIVNYLESKHPQDGLNLCRATIDGLIKYKALFDPSKHKPGPGGCQFLYAADAGTLDWVGESTQQPIEGQMADWADQIAYSVNDIEDNIRAGILDVVQIEKRSGDIAAHARDKLARRSIALKDAEVEDITSSLIRRLFDSPRTERERKISLKTWTSESIYRLIRSAEVQERAGDWPSIRYRLQLKISDEGKKLAAILKAISTVLVFENPRVKTLEYKGGVILKELFEILRSDASLLPYDFQEMNNDRCFSTCRIVADFISGMTDHYAQQYFARLTDPGHGSFYEHV